MESHPNYQETSYVDEYQEDILEEECVTFLTNLAVW